MSSSNPQKKEINNKDSYYHNFALSTTIFTQNKQRKQEKILEYALDICKFEIQIYWERTKYFIFLIAGSFGGYGLFVSNIFDIAEEIRGSVLLLLTFIGFILSLAWYLSNRGSKYWQGNWERHVDVLEDDIIGPLYKTTLSFDQKNFDR
ncbi:MAG TPA: hypothetical protein ACFCUY_08650 [Xenococcaceae cyanobacterium]|jgi:hypothetical protein